MPFVELLGKSCFSFLTGASHPEELVERAATLGMSALGLCDRDGLYGTVRAHNQAKESGVRLIVGTEATLAASEVTRAPELEGLRMATRADKLAHELAPRLALLAKDHVGYMNLCRLLTEAHAGLPKGLSWLTVKSLASHHEGLIAVVTPPRRLGHAWRELKAAERFAAIPGSLLVDWMASMPGVCVSCSIGRTTWGQECSPVPARSTTCRSASSSRTFCAACVSI